MSFDLKVQHRDAKTGRITEVNPYRLHIKGNKKYYERPVGSGNLWFEDGTPANAHKEYTAPLTNDQKMAAEFSAKDSKIRATEEKLAASEKELKEIKAEAAAKKAPAEDAPKENKNVKQAGNANSNSKK